jgi:DNA end-binding protein Ku
MLRKSDLCPVKYLRVCKNDGKEIPYDEIVKGYEYTDGEYVVLTDEDFENADVEQTKAIDILDFINEYEVDSRYFEKPYYLEPDKGGDKAYALLREALKKSKKVGVANFVMANRGHIGIVKPHGKVLILNQIRYADEIRDVSKLNLPEARNVHDREIDLALTLIEQLSGKFHPEKYKDTYTEYLKKVVAEKARGIKPKAKGKAPKPTKIIDLMAVLKKSLKEQNKSKHKKKGKIKHKLAA